MLEDQGGCPCVIAGVSHGVSLQTSALMHWNYIERKTQCVPALLNMFNIATPQAFIPFFQKVKDM